MFLTKKKNRTSNGLWLFGIFLSSRMPHLAYWKIVQTWVGRFLSVRFFKNPDFPNGQFPPLLVICQAKLSMPDFFSKLLRFLFHPDGDEVIYHIFSIFLEMMTTEIGQIRDDVPAFFISSIILR